MPEIIDLSQEIYDEMPVFNKFLNTYVYVLSKMSKEI